MIIDTLNFTIPFTSWIGIASPHVEFPAHSAALSPAFGQAILSKLCITMCGKKQHGYAWWTLVLDGPPPFLYTLGGTRLISPGSPHPELAGDRDFTFAVPLMAYHTPNWQEIEILPKAKKMAFKMLSAVGFHRRAEVAYALWGDDSDYRRKVRGR
ncbi:uncharacterized protein HD556DRAFT_1307579 [Suillus plorans]|uniref:Uncharacterized protein n=1 Tax=Suillus plorans TaxID=116603 RepID=A0A9P7AS91_9AGAM|nr:uncharacterized protein HD556DRAFT_1307579 [Suillus plorans]KAG1795427.1 hypothetical protein HD556DRAFT_1307579 [Suillus plorans]